MDIFSAHDECEVCVRLGGLVDKINAGTRSCDLELVDAQIDQWIEVLEQMKYDIASNPEGKSTLRMLSDLEDTARLFALCVVNNSPRVFGGAVRDEQLRLSSMN